MAISINCKICNQIFSVKKYRIDTAKYCSRKCQFIGTTKKRTKQCEYCKTEFDYIATREGKAKYCSNSCKGKARQNIGGSISFQCHHCHKIFYDSPSVKRKYCSKVCVNKAQKEIWNPHFTTVRKAMLARGEITQCEVCGYKEHINILGVHHIDENRRNNNRDNLLIVCPMCHSLIHNKHICH